VTPQRIYDSPQFIFSVGWLACTRRVPRFVSLSSPLAVGTQPRCASAEISSSYAII